MSKVTYIPNPIDTSGIALPEGLAEVREKVAEHVHDVWSTGRIKEGWSYGETKDSDRKTNPCLVPYEELSDGEKEYDRNTAEETIKLLIALGYKIVR